MFNLKNVLLAAVFPLVFQGFGLGPAAFASETDAFTLRYQEFKSGIPAINAEVNRRFKLALQDSNRRQAKKTAEGCSELELERAFKKQFLFPLYGRIEGFINATDSVTKRHVPLDQSIYKYINFFDMMPAHLGLIGFGNIIRSNSFLIGSDKFGHFFDEGFHYYQAINDGTSLADAMKYGISTEDGIFGLGTTGVKSYADMAANFAGAHFWSNVLLPVLGQENYNPFLECSRGQWTQIRSFDFLDYIDAAWDEGINCSDFRNPAFEASVDKAISELELKSGNRYHCPVYPEECKTLKTKYGKYADIILNSKCLNSVE